MQYKELNCTYWRIYVKGKKNINFLWDSLSFSFFSDKWNIFVDKYKRKTIKTAYDLSVCTVFAFFLCCKNIHKHFNYLLYIIIKKKTICATILAVMLKILWKIMNFLPVSLSFSVFLTKNSTILLTVKPAHVLSVFTVLFE